MFTCASHSAEFIFTFPLLWFGWQIPVWLWQGGLNRPSACVCFAKNLIIWAVQKCSDWSPGGVWCRGCLSWVGWEGACLFGSVSGRTGRPIWCRSLFRSGLNHALRPCSIGVASKIKPGHYCDVTIMQLQICMSRAAGTDVLYWHDDIYSSFIHC